MTEIISVRFKNKGKSYFFDANNITVLKGQQVIVETAKGLEFADCVQGNHMVPDDELVLPLRPVLRIATEADKLRAEDNKRLEREALVICEQKIAEHGLDMKLVDVEYNFDGTKILFFFTSDGRVDFRELVKDLAAQFKTRIELRQIGVRDEARMLGGLGICGKPFCCAQFLDDFQPVSIKMAKTQGLSLNPTKISGTCGRLMCCLKYEQDAYEDLVKNAPKLDAFVDTPAGKGSVMDVNLLRRTARIRMEDAADTPVKTFSFDDLEVLGGKAKRAEYLQNLEKQREEEKLKKPEPKLDVKSELAQRPISRPTPIEEKFPQPPKQGQKPNKNRQWQKPKPDQPNSIEKPETDDRQPRPSYKKTFNQRKPVPQQPAKVTEQPLQPAPQASSKAGEKKSFYHRKNHRPKNYSGGGNKE